VAAKKERIELIFSDGMEFGELIEIICKLRNQDDTHALSILC
jgi:hypothetical protein